MSLNSNILISAVFFEKFNLNVCDMLIFNNVQKIGGYEEMLTFAEKVGWWVGS